VMNLSPTLVEPETDPTFEEVGIFPILVFLLMIILTSAFLIRARTPTYLVVVFFWPAIFVGAYFILMVGVSWSILMIILMIIISVLAIWKGSKEGRLFPYLGAVAIIGVFLFVVMFLGGGGEMISEGIGGNGEGISFPFEDPGGHIETTFGNLGTFLLVILVGGIIAFLLVQKMIPFIKTSTEKKKDEIEIEDQLSYTMDRAVTELRQGKDVHSTILRCYQRMCLILEEKGAKNFEFMTPREFERQALDTLNVSTSRISEIRKVFELAKYSGHQLGEKERTKALKALKKLRNELE